MERMQRIYNGYALIGDSKYLYRYEDNKMTIYTGNAAVDKEHEYSRILTYGEEKHIDQATLYQLSSSITIGFPFTEATENVRYRIGNYKEGTRYFEMTFSFPELDYFYPSTGLYERTDKGYLISRTTEEVDEIRIRYKEYDLYVALMRSIDHRITRTVNLQTYSTLRVRFDKTADIEQLLGIYYSIRAFFCFICNRQNIGLREATLIGLSTERALETTSLDGKLSKIESVLIPNDKYLESCEDERELRNTIRYSSIKDHFAELMQMFFPMDDTQDAIVPSHNIHASVKARSLIDLNLSLHISATFEYLYRTRVRNMMPKDNESLSLSDRIMRTYDGYGEWPPVASILNPWYGKDISSLAETVRKWRNELAHENRNYNPDINTVHGIRLLECVNYCIILRLAGYSDDDIKAIVDNILSVVPVPTTA